MNAFPTRIWRSPRSRFNEDEPLQSAAVYTPGELDRIAEQGFNALWMRGRLRELMRSVVFPELNDPDAGRRIANLRRVIHDAASRGLRLFLFFHEPMALERNHPFWRTHPELKGEPYCEPDFDWDMVSLCTSTEAVMRFFRESVANLFDDLPGLGGVILITASESQSHCWSHKALLPVGDAYIDKGLGPMQCPRCAARTPADVVAELVGVWSSEAVRQPLPPEVWVWNWSWSMWYGQPQHEVVAALPPGVRVLIDFERGGRRRQGIGEVFIDEYSLGYPGPSERFSGASAAARAAGLPVCAKIQLGVTHELATVPNLPLIPNLFEKFRCLDELKVQGVMASWNFGNSPSLNTAAFRLFVERSELRRDIRGFCLQLARDQFSGAAAEPIVAAWEAFCAAFHEYPFSLKTLYFGPMNYAVAYPLSPDYHARPMGPTWCFHEPFGDRLGDCLGPFTVDQVVDCLERMLTHWRAGLALYGGASEPELACATMIGLHLEAARNVFLFHRWRAPQIEGSGTLPVRLRADREVVALAESHCATLAQAAALAAEHPEFGVHQEPGASLYTADTIGLAIAETRRWLKGVAG
jgi:hypothetical protein